MTTYRWSDQSFEGWLALLHERSTTRAARSVLNVLMQQPERASHATLGVVADAAGVNVGSVTRAAQALGYEGWPDLREELRSRYLTSLNRPEADQLPLPAGSDTPFAQSFDSDLRTTSRTRSRIRREVVHDAAAAFAAAGTRLAVGAGTYAPVAQLVASIATLSGYRTDVPPEGTTLINAVGRLGEGDAVFAVGFWRHHVSTVLALDASRRRGATICVLTDQMPSPLTEHADYVLPVSAESATFFPSLTAAVATVNAFCAELAALDPNRTSTSVRVAEVEWSLAGLFHRTSIEKAPE